jgi:preprotein translocase subunit SecE
MADESISPDETPEFEEESPESARPAPTPRRQPGASPLRVYKPGQGMHVRWGTAAGAGLIALAGFLFLREWLRVPFGDNVVAQTLIPVAALLVVGYLLFWLVGRRPSTVDFMIATEGEMKKVNWSSRKEVFGATKVVIVTVVLLGTLLFMVDLMFILLFAAINVLKIPIWQRWFGAGEQ